MTVVVAKFWLAPGSRHVSLVIRSPQKWTTGYAKQSLPLETSPDRFWGCTSSRGDFLPSRARWQLQPTPLISAIFMEFVMPPDHPMLQSLQQIPTSV